MNGKYVCILYANETDAREMRLSIPHPGHFEALKEIVAVKASEGLSEVKEVFMGGSPDIMGSGRGVFHAPLISEIRSRRNSLTSTAHDVR